MIFLALTWSAALLAPCPLQDLPLNIEAHQLPQPLEPHCLLYALDRGFLGLLQTIDPRSLSPQVRQRIHQLLRTKRTYFTQLLQRPQPGQETVIQPVVEWTQDDHYINLKVRLSHRWDSPPCTRLEGPPVLQQGEEGTLLLEMKCIMSGKRFRFRLSKKLFGQLKDLKLQGESLGQYSVKGYKYGEGHWPRLFEEEPGAGKEQ